MRKMIAKKRSKNRITPDSLTDEENQTKFKVKRKGTEESFEVNAESIGEEMTKIGIKLEPISDHIPRFKLCLPKIDFPQLIVKSLFYMLVEKNSEFYELIDPS